MVQRFSEFPQLIVDLRRVGFDRAATSDAVVAACAALDVNPPDVSFHRGRGPHTGWTRPPRWVAIEKWGEEPVSAWERRHGPWPERGMLRFGDPTAAGTIAHELGHHLVNVLDRPSTPSHGKLWVHRYDEATRTIRGLLTESG